MEANSPLIATGSTVPQYPVADLRWIATQTPASNLLPEPHPHKPAIAPRRQSLRCAQPIVGATAEERKPRRHPRHNLSLPAARTSAASVPAQQASVDAVIGMMTSWQKAQHACSLNAASQAPISSLRSRSSAGDLLAGRCSGALGGRAALGHWPTLLQSARPPRRLVHQPAPLLHRPRRPQFLRQPRRRRRHRRRRRERVEHPHVEPRAQLRRHARRARQRSQRLPHALRPRLPRRRAIHQLPRQAHRRHLRSRRLHHRPPPRQWSQRPHRLPPERRHRERRLHRPRRLHPARHPRPQRPLHRPRPRAAVAAPVPAHAGLRAHPWPRLVADQRQRLHRQPATHLQPGHALARHASHRHPLRPLQLSMHAAALHPAPRRHLRPRRASTSSSQGPAPPGKTDTLSLTPIGSERPALLSDRTGNARRQRARAPLAPIHRRLEAGEPGTPHRRSQASSSSAVGQSRDPGRHLPAGSMGTSPPDPTRATTISPASPCSPETGRTSFSKPSPSIPSTPVQYTVGPYTDNSVQPSGSNSAAATDVLPSYRNTYTVSSPPMPRQTSCSPGSLGTETAPAAVDAFRMVDTGFSADNAAPPGRPSRSRATAPSPSKSTAEDEQGFATTAKAMPVIGLWNTSDPTGTLPTLAAATDSFNSQATGVTALTFQSNATRATAHGHRRPARRRPPRLHLSGNGSSTQTPSPPPTSPPPAEPSPSPEWAFAPAIPSRSAASRQPYPAGPANTITATVPSLHDLGSATALVADVTVNDLVTGGVTVMSRALTYGTPAPTLNLVTAPSGTIAPGQTAAVPFAVRALAADGITPLAGQSITFTASAGTVNFGACGAATCTLQTDATGSRIDHRHSARDRPHHPVRHLAPSAP